MAEKPARSDTLALSLIEAESLDFYCDIVGQPRVRLPPTGNQGPDETWCLRSDRFRAWIAQFIWDRSQRILLDREINRILNVLEGRAWQNHRVDIEIYEAIEHEPVLEALLLFLDRERRFEGTMTQLMQCLKKAARRAGLDVRAGTWPRGTPQLSSRIRQLEHLLTRAHITVERRRDSYQRRIILKRQTSDDAASSPSQAASVDKSHHPQNLRRNDASDAEKRASVFARVDQPPVRSDS